MDDHKFKPFVLADVFVASPIDPMESLPHGLNQVGLATDCNRSDVLTLGMLMEHPEKYLVKVACRYCPESQGSST